jgi:hypothetical protein
MTHRQLFELSTWDAYCTVMGKKPANYYVCEEGHVTIIDYSTGLLQSVCVKFFTLSPRELVYPTRPKYESVPSLVGYGL